MTISRVEGFDMRNVKRGVYGPAEESGILQDLVKVDG